MKNIEVEHRGHLSKEKFNELKSFFTKEAKFLGHKKRFSIIYTDFKNSSYRSGKEEIDIKLRITNKEPEFVVKYGKQSGNDARQEFEFPLQTEDKFHHMFEVLRILGRTRAVLMANTKYDYLYNGITFSLVEVPDWGQYFEAEIVADKQNLDEANKTLEKEISTLGLETLNQKDYMILLKELNDRDDFKIEITDTTFKELKERFKDYF